MGCQLIQDDLTRFTSTVMSMFKQMFLLLPWFCRNCPDNKYTVGDYGTVVGSIRSIKRNKPMFFGEAETLEAANEKIADFYSSFKPDGDIEANSDAMESFRQAWKIAFKNRADLQLRSTETKLMKYFYEIISGDNHTHLPELQAIARQVGFDVVPSARAVSINGGWKPRKGFAGKTAELNKITKSLFGGQEVTPQLQQKIKAEKPEQYKQYQQVAKDRRHVAWLRLVEIFDEEGWFPTIDSAALHIRLKQEQLEEFLPLTFRGRVGIGADGYPLRFYTYAGLELDAVPLNDVEMNMDYAEPASKPSKAHPIDDSTFYCQTTAMVGTAKTKYYTVDYRRRARGKKFDTVESLAMAIDDIRKRMLRHVNSKHRDTAVRALMCMFIDHTCARIGNMTSAKAVKQTFGVTTLQTKKHARIEEGKIVISYTGKHEQQQEHVFRIFKTDAEKKANRVEAIIAEKLQSLIEEGDEFLFTNSEGKPFTPQQVNEYFRADEPNPDAKLPSGGANSPCTVHCFRNFHATRMFDEFAGVFASSANDRTYREVLNAYQGCKETKDSPAVEGILTKIAKHLGNTPAICRKAYISPASQLLFFRKWGYRPPDGLLKDVYHDEHTDPYGVEKQKEFKFAKQRAATSRRRVKVSSK